MPLALPPATRRPRREFLPGVQFIPPGALGQPASGPVVLGQGCFGVVTLQVLQGHQRPVAVKKVGAGNRRALNNEVLAMAWLSGHPSFPEFHGVVRDGAGFSMVMEFVGDPATGTSLTLSDALDGPSRLALAPVDWWKVAVGLVDGMNHMHEQAGLLHNDLKSDNILMARVGGVWSACIIDVGLCSPKCHPKTRHPTASEKAWSQLHQTHLAPELLEGQPQSRLSDVFQLGLVLHLIGHYGGVPGLVQHGLWGASKDPKSRPSLAVLRLAVEALY